MVQAKQLWIKTLVGRWKPRPDIKSLGLDPCKTNGSYANRSVTCRRHLHCTMTFLQKEYPVFWSCTKCSWFRKKGKWYFSFAELTSRAKWSCKDFSGGMEKRVRFVVHLSITKNCLFRWADRSYWPTFKATVMDLFRELAKTGVTLSLVHTWWMKPCCATKVTILERRNYCCWHASENTGRGKTILRFSENSEIRQKYYWFNSEKALQKNYTNWA